MQSHKKEVVIALSVIFLYLFYTDFLLIPLYLIGIDINSWATIYKVIFLLVAESLFVFTIFMIYKKDMLTDWDDFKKNWKKYLDEYFKYWLIMLALMYASNFLILIIQKLAHHKEAIAGNEEAVRKILSNFPIYMIFTAVVIGPLEEEIVFRKTCKKIFSDRWVFIIFSGLFFGLMHVVLSMKEPFDLLYIISYSIPGWMFAYIYDKSKNIFVSTTLHTIHNGILIFLQLLLAII
ncbi:MAG: CPBP family intramembrane metalloprotease [Bacilli bacterium]|nr:CPBP family intramembrane metalloprotease [Bacilli bacterium]